jgi:hypothetical protein
VKINQPLTFDDNVLTADTGSRTHCRLAQSYRDAISAAWQSLDRNDLGSLQRQVPSVGAKRHRCGRRRHLGTGNLRDQYQRNQLGDSH